MFFVPDLTGTSPDYLVNNDVYTVFTTAQRISFNKPIFLSSIKINRIGNVNTLLVQNTDWQVTPATDIDYTATARILNYDASFTATLVNALEIISTAAPPYQIAISYQQLYPVDANIALAEGGAVELTPNLIANILQRVATLESEQAASANTNATTIASPKLLPLDVNETITGNVVTEVQTVNVFQNQNVIRPVCGAFFPDSLVLIQAGATTPMVVNTDYVVFGADIAKIKTTSKTCGVYNFILVLKQYAGNITVQYHAYGGDVTLYDMNAVYQQLVNVNNFLNAAQYLTPSQLGTSAPFLSLLNRVTTLETEMRNLLNSTPTYGDASSGTAVVLKIRSTDNAFHWWSIASLYLVAGSTVVTTADRMHFRMDLQTAHLSADVFVNVDLALPNPFQIDTISVNQNLEYTPFTSYGVAPVCMPQFRILYNSASNGISGIVLQIGMVLTSLAETIGIQDLSGSESCWLLGIPPSSAVSPQDGMVPLPNSTYIWDPTNQGSVALNHMMPNKTGYLLWGGAQALSGLTANSAFALVALVPPTILIADIKKLRLQLTTSADTTSVVTLDVPVMVYTDGTKTSGSGYIINTPDDNLPIGISVHVTNNGAVVGLSVTLDRIPGTTTLSLRHVIALFG